MRRFANMLICAAGLLSVSAVSSPAATASHYSFVVLPTSAGYPSKPTSIFVEDFGYAWIGTDDGIFRVEGNGSRQFTSRDKFPLSLPGDEIYSIFTDAESNFWVLTDKGLSAQQTRTGDNMYRDIAAVDRNVVAYSAVCTASAVYLGGENKIWKYEYATKSFSEVTMFDSDAPFRIKKMFMGVLGRVLLFGESGNEAFFFYPETDRVEKVDPATYPWADDYYAVFMDSEYRLWVSSYNRGVVRYDHYGKAIDSYNEENGNLSNNLVTCFTEKDGSVWVGTGGGGINIFNLRRGERSVLRQDPSDPRTMPANKIQTLFCDSNGKVWAGRESGGIFIISDTYIDAYRTGDIRPHINSEGIMSLYQDPIRGDVWVGTNGSGLLKYNPVTGRYTDYPETAGLQIFSISSFKNRELLLSCPTTGLFCFNQDTGKLGPAPEAFGPVDDYLRFESMGACLVNDDAGNVISLTDEVSRYLVQSNVFECFNLPPEIDHTTLRAIPGSGARLFYDSGHVYKWDNALADKISTLYNAPEGNIIHTAIKGANNDVWMALDEGLYHYDLTIDEIRTFELGMQDKPSAMVCDRMGNLWIGSKSALYHFDTETTALVTLNELDGAFDNEYEPYASMLSSSGDVFMGGVEGLVRINSEIRFNVGRDPEVIVSEVKVDREIITDFAGIAIPSNFRDFFVRFFIRDSELLRQKRCRFHVTGPKTDYVEETDLLMTSFRGLRPGLYTIAASSITKDGHWTSPVEVLKFRVRTPWYLSWWFFLILTVVAVSATLVTMRIMKQENRFNLEKEANEERLNFLVNVSHELRTPLTLVMGPLARILREMPQDDRYYDKLQHVFTQANRMKTLLNTILTTNKIKAGATAAKLAPVNINEWVMNCISSFKDEAAGRNMEIETQLDSTISTVNMDDNLCQIVFSNIMMNGLKHNRPGQSILVRTEPRPESRMMRVSITDHGTGFGDVDMSQLFVRFYRVKEDQTGFGIGLAYAKTIIDEHRGNIGAYNNPDGIGATFWFEIPFELQASSEQDFNLPGAEPVESDVVKVKNVDLTQHTMLFVDDDPDLRMYVNDEMEGVFKKFYMASNGVEALKIMASNRIDIVVSDVMMPEMDGIELCKQIKKSHHVPVILLSARADNASAKQGYAAKADIYLPKPFKTDKLLQSISSLL